MAVLSTFLTCFRGFFAVVLEVTTAMLAAFFAGFRSFLFIFSEITGTATMFSHDISS